MQRSLVALFSRPHGQPIRKGPYAHVRFEGELLREAPGGAVIAQHGEHRWMVDGEAYSRLDFEEPVKVHFSRAESGDSRTYGPFRSFSCVDGIAYKEGSVFAFVDRGHADWYCHDDGQHWPLMVVEPA